LPRPCAGANAVGWGSGARRCYLLIISAAAGPPTRLPDQVGVADLPISGGGIAELAAPLSPICDCLCERERPARKRRVGVSMSRFNRTRVKTERARRLRLDGTDVERRLWWRLRNGQICEAHFRRQHPAGPYTLDFFCPALCLAIELDGGQHAQTGARDRVRDEWLRQQGVTVLRFWNSDVIDNVDGVLEVIAAKVNELSVRGIAPIERWRSEPRVDPHPALTRRPPPFRGR
jgi:very-short-patch-repair endonuclease